MLSFDFDKTYRSLPRSPDLGHLRDEAKSLKKSCASGNTGAIAFVEFHLGRTTTVVQLADAQFALARSWVQELASAQGVRRGPGALARGTRRVAIGIFVY